MILVFLYRKVDLIVLPAQGLLGWDDILFFIETV